MALVINDLFTALGFERFEIRVNNRLVLNGLLEALGLADKAVPLLRSLDKLPKIGREKVTEEMVPEAGVTAEQAGRVLDLAETTGTNAEILDRVERDFARRTRRRPRASAGCASCSRWRRRRACRTAASRST